MCEVLFRIWKNAEIGFFEMKVDMYQNPCTTRDMDTWCSKT